MIQTKVNELNGWLSVWWDDRPKDLPPAEVAAEFRDAILRANVREAVVGNQEPAVAKAMAAFEGFSILGEDQEYARSWPSGCSETGLTGVRMAGAADAEKVAGVIRGSFPAAEAGFYTVDRVRKDMEDPDRYDILLSEGGAEIAFGSAIHDGEEGILNFVAVVREAQRKGLGSRIMRILLTELDRVEHQRISLLVGAGNAPAIGLYRKFGFEMSGGPFVHVKYDRPDE